MSKILKWFPLFKLETNAPSEATNTVIDEKLIGDSIESTYVPFYATLIGNRIDVNGKSALLYNLPISKAINVIKRMDYKRLFSEFKDENYFLSNPDSIIFEDINFQAYKGILYRVDWFEGTPTAVILMTLAIRPEDLWKFDVSNPDYSKFVLLVSKEFRENEEYSILYKRAIKEFTPLCEEGNIDVVYTNSIEDKCFRTVHSAPRFRTPRELSQYLESLNQII